MSENNTVARTRSVATLGRLPVRNASTSSANRSVSTGVGVSALKLNEAGAWDPLGHPSGTFD